MCTYVFFLLFFTLYKLRYKDMLAWRRYMQYAKGLKTDLLLLYRPIIFWIHVHVFLLSTGRKFLRYSDEIWYIVVQGRKLLKLVPIGSFSRPFRRNLESRYIEMPIFKIFQRNLVRMLGKFFELPFQITVPTKKNYFSTLRGETWFIIVKRESTFQFFITIWN